MTFLYFDYAQMSILGSVTLALLLGALIGFDRELADRPAGLRTHMLVAGAAALFVSLGDVLVTHFDLAIHADILRTDPIRLIEAVITGISFLGAGTIIRQESSQKVEGLTTAASILVAAGVGVCVALSQFILAVGVTGLVLFVLRVLHILEKRLGTSGVRTS
jgi:putative Mg2+ transporter-C (MgtC) family protein